MRVAYLCTEFPPRIYGGLGVYVDCISREMVALEQDVSVFVPGDTDLASHEMTEGVEVFREIPVPMRDGLEVFFSSQSLAWGPGLDLLLDLLSYNQLAASRLLQESPFDLCVAHDWLALPGALAVKQKGTPLIYHVHGLETGRSEHPNHQLVTLEKKGAATADLVITVSEAMRQELKGIGVSEEKIRVCYHGVDSEFFDPSKIDPGRLEKLREKYGLGVNDTLILFIGRLEPVKGVIQLIQAMPKVLEKHPRAKLIMVGKGSLECLVRSEANRLGFLTLVTDFIDQEAKAYHYALADLCVFPSLYEPFGIVALEAAAMGKVAVVGAGGVSGLREIVENPSADMPTGVHVNPQDPGDIAWGINLALEDPDRLKAWGNNARERVLKQFTWRQAAEITLEIYKEAAISRR
jgi:glycosyltransferase involved in cell wall biosynthesis